MEYIIVAFRSRQHTMRFYEFIKENGINCEITNTPKEAGVGCGLSVKVNKDFYSHIKKAVKITGYSSFIGIFYVKNSYGYKQVKSI